MNKIKFFKTLVLLSALFLMSCGENNNGIVSNSLISSLEKPTNDSKSNKDTYTEDFSLKPGMTKTFDSDNLPFKSFSYFEVTNNSNYGNFSCEKISVSYFYGGPNTVFTCLGFRETMNDGFNPGMLNLGIMNLSDKALTFKVNIYNK